MFGYKKRQRYADQYFHRELALASGANATGENALRVGKHLGSQTLIVAANGAVSFAAGAKLTIDLFESDTKDGTYTLHPSMASVTLTAPSGGISFADGQDIIQLVLPDAKTFMKVRLTSASGATGTFDIFLDYLAR